MKKQFIAWLIVILVMTLPALAEVNIASMSVSRVEIVYAGETISLGDLHAVFNVEAGDSPVVSASLFDGQTHLGRAMAQLYNRTLRCMVDGDNTTYVLDLAPFGQQLILMPAYLQMLLPQLEHLSLPAFPGIELLKPDAVALLSDYMTDGTHFELSSDQMIELSNALVELIRAFNTTHSLQLNLSNDVLEQVIARRVSAEGEVVEVDGVQRVTALIRVAEAAGAEPLPYARLDFTGAENQCTMQLDSADDRFPSIAAALRSDPAGPTLNLNMTFEGQTGIILDLLPEDGLQKIVLDINYPDSVLTSEFGYGRPADKDVVLLNLNMDDLLLDFRLESALEPNGHRIGDFKVRLGMDGEDMTIKGRVILSLFESPLPEYHWPSATASINRLPDALTQWLKPIDDRL